MFRSAIWVCFLLLYHGNWPQVIFEEQRIIWLWVEAGRSSSMKLASAEHLVRAWTVSQQQDTASMPDTTHFYNEVTHNNPLIDQSVNPFTRTEPLGPNPPSASELCSTRDLVSHILLARSVVRCGGRSELSGITCLLSAMHCCASQLKSYMKGTNFMYFKYTV